MFFAAYTAKELANLASVLKISGRSSMKKQELYDAIAEVINAAHVEALEEQDTRDIVHTAGAFLPSHNSHEDFWEADSQERLPAIVRDERYPLSAYLNEGQKRLPRRIKKELRKRGWL